MKTKSNCNVSFLIRTALFLFLSMIFFNAWAAESLGMFIEAKRYFDNSKYTKYEIDYQVPYQNLMFSLRDRVYYAELKVNVTVSEADSIVYTKEFVNYIGVSSKNDVTNSSKTYVDRISMTLARPGFTISLTFEDVNSEKKNSWSYSVVPLDKSVHLSDIELISKIFSDSTSLSAKFKRGDMYFLPNPSGVFSKGSYDSLFCYVETYLPVSQKGELNFSLYQNNTEVMSKTYQLEGEEQAQSQLLTLHITDLDVGKYTGKISLKTQGRESVREFQLLLNNIMEQSFFIFTDPDDEYQLLKYLLPVKSQANWQEMSKEAKRSYNSHNWEILASSQNLPVTDAIEKYKGRIQYCNKFFSHFDPGWKTDMGRIYIRLGAPYDLEKDTTGDDTKFVRKDYQVWKYKSNGSPVYIFIDMQMNGNYRLVYAKNDDNEKTYPDWRKYLGSEFDEEQLTKKQQE